MIASAWTRFWFSEGSLLRLAYFRILLMVLCLMDLIAYSGPAFANAQLVSSGVPVANWRPIYLFSALGIEPMGSAAAQAVFCVAIVAVVFALIGFYTRTACLVAGTLVLYWTAFCYSFDQPHHEKIAMAFALIVLPCAPVGARFSIDAFRRRLKLASQELDPQLPDSSADASFPLLLTQVTIVFGYTFAGWTKLAVSGFEWANGYTLMAILLEYDNVLSRAFASNLAVSQLFSWGALILQVTFPLVMFFPRLRWVYLPSATAFHLTTWLTMGGAHYITLWFMMIAFVPLERIPSWIRAGLRGASALRKASVLAIVLVPAIGATWVLFLVLPKWLLVFLIVPVIGISLSLSTAPKLEVWIPPDALRTRALLQSLDWSGRLLLRESTANQTVLHAKTPQAEMLEGRDARVAVLRNLPLTRLLAGFAR